LGKLKIDNLLLKYFTTKTQKHKNSENVLKAAFFCVLVGVFEMNN